MGAQAATYPAPEARWFRAAGGPGSQMLWGVMWNGRVVIIQLSDDLSGHRPGCFRAPVSGRMSFALTGAPLPCPRRAPGIRVQYSRNLTQSSSSKKSARHPKRPHRRRTRSPRAVLSLTESDGFPDTSNSDSVSGLEEEVYHHGQVLFR